MGQNNKRVLVIDDERDLVTTLRYRLEAAEVDVLVAFDGMEGIEKARSDRPDLILLDVMMPKMDGYQVCRALKRDHITKRIPVVFLTARGQDSDRVMGMQAGCDGYVVKPFDSIQLLLRIKELLDAGKV